MNATIGKVLVVEDESRIRRFVCDALGREGCETFEAGNVGDGLALAGAQHPDLIVLDLGLPDKSGLDLIRNLRTWSHTPILILSARITEQDKVTALDAGADDYLTKPFALPELEARVRALTRRGTAQSKVIEFGCLSYDQGERVARCNGHLLDLSARELALLEILLLRVGRLVSKDQLVDHLCGWGEEVSTNAIEVYIHRLRKKLEPEGIRIATVRGLGYCLDKPQGDAVGSA